jgi:hypothetical protein
MTVSVIGSAVYNTAIVFMIIISKNSQLKPAYTGCKKAAGYKQEQ